MPIHQSFSETCQAFELNEKMSKKRVARAPIAKYNLQHQKGDCHGK